MRTGQGWSQRVRLSRKSRDSRHRHVWKTNMKDMTRRSFVRSLVARRRSPVLAWDSPPIVPAPRSAYSVFLFRKSCKPFVFDEGVLNKRAPLYVNEVKQAGRQASERADEQANGRSNQPAKPQVFRTLVPSLLASTVAMHGFMSLTHTPATRICAQETL